MFSKKLFWAVPVALLASCGSSNDYSNKTASTVADSAVAGHPGSVSEGTPLNSPERKIIRTVDFHCKVQNVLASVTQLEDMVKSAGGIVQESKVENSNNETKTIYYKPDSLKQMQTYTTTAFMTLKVPVAHLDSIISAIPGLTCFIDSRNLRQNDVTYRYLANELKNASGETNYVSREINLAKKSKDVMQVQQFEDSKREQKIDRKIENLQLTDDVTYATITVAFAQPEQVFAQTIVNPEYVTSIPFFTKCRMALNSGADILSSIIVGLISIWPLLVIAILGTVIYRKLRHKWQL